MMKEVTDLSFRESFSIQFRDASLRHSGTILPLLLLGEIIGRFIEYPALLLYSYFILLILFSLFLLNLVSHVREQFSNLWLISLPDPEADIDTFADEFRHSLSLKEDRRIDSPNSTFSVEWPSRYLGRALAALLLSLLLFYSGILILAVLMKTGVFYWITGTVSTINFQSDNIFWLIPREVIAGPLSEILSQSFRTFSIKDTVTLVIMFGPTAAHSIMFVRNFVRAIESVHFVLLQCFMSIFGRQWIGVFLLWVLYAILFLVI